jgi:hypothetical protein
MQVVEDGEVLNRRTLRGLRSARIYICFPCPLDLILFCQGALGWEYKSFFPITGVNSGAFTPNGSVSMPHIYAFSRPRPEAVWGRAQPWAFDPKTTAFRFSFLQAAAPVSGSAAPTIIFLPMEVVYPTGANLTLCTDPPGVVEWSVQAPPPYTPLDPAAPRPFAWQFLALTMTTGAPAASVNVSITAGSRAQHVTASCSNGFIPPM